MNFAKVAKRAAASTLAAGVASLNLFAFNADSAHAGETQLGAFKYKTTIKETPNGKFRVRVQSLSNGPVFPILYKGDKPVSGIRLYCDGSAPRPMRRASTNSFVGQCPQGTPYVTFKAPSGWILIGNTRAYGNLQLAVNPGQGIGPAGVYIVKNTPQEILNMVK